MAGLLGAPRDSNGGAAAIPARQADAGIVVLPADPAMMSIFAIHRYLLFFIDSSCYDDVTPELYR